MNCENSGKSQSDETDKYNPSWKSSGEGLYKTPFEDIRAEEPWELASPSQGRRPRSCRHFSLNRILGK